MRKMKYFFDVLKIIAFVFAFVAMSMIVPYSKVMEVSYSLVYFFLFVVFAVTFLQTILFAINANKNTKKMVRFMIQFVELNLIGIALYYFYSTEIFNSVLFFWLIPLFARWYLPTIFCFFKKRDA